MKLTLNKIIFKDEEEKRYKLREAYNTIESHFKGKSVTYIDQGLTVEYIVNNGIYNQTQKEGA